MREASDSGTSNKYRQLTLFSYPLESGDVYRAQNNKPVVARRSSHTSSSRRSRNGKKNNSSSRFLIIGGLICAIVIIGLLVWLITRPPSYTFQRSQLDKYVEMTHNVHLLNDGASVYVDMSDGMNYAYSTPESKAMLQAIINKLAANQAIRFYGLADEKITPLDYTHTQLYNYMLNRNSYDKQKAPIEATLQRIISENQPALLMTDFEEYKGLVIEQAAYAKKYFIAWLANGNNITFYKWDFVEKGKAKHMFLAVFDDNANRLNSLVENAVSLTDPNTEKYVLGCRNFAYPTSTRYISLKQGGNYHNDKGIDVVTAVMENGGLNDYVSYAKPFATANGAPGQFAPLDISLGVYAEFYPLGVNWTDAIANAKRMQEAGIPDDIKYNHLLSDLYIDFGAQNGFNIENVEVRVFDMGNTMMAISNKGDSIKTDEIERIEKPEVNMFLAASMHEVKDLPIGWKEITVDFDSQFNGAFIGDINPTNLFRANIVISKATPNIAKVNSFFGWPGNPSLANSITETLTAGSSNPQGRILYTYYIKTISE